jgi:serine protease Do
VVGINTAIATETGQFAGIGFAIPSNMAKPVYTQLKENGKMVRGYIGVEIGSVTDDVDLARSFGYNETTGVLVNSTFPDTPAFGKLKRGDIITAINGKKVKDRDQLRNQVAATEPGKDLTFTVFRRGKTIDVPITIGEQPEEIASLRRGGGSGDNDEGGPAHNEMSAKGLGIHVMTATDDLTSKFGLDAGTKGAIVTSVDRKSPAARAGIVPGDVITEVGDESIETARQATDALGKQDLSKGIRLSITNQLGSRFVLLKEEAK